jgi:hypothetical protein
VDEIMKDYGNRQSEEEGSTNPEEPRRGHISSKS